MIEIEAASFKLWEKFDDHWGNYYLKRVIKESRQSDLLLRFFEGELENYGKTHSGNGRWGLLYGA